MRDKYKVGKHFELSITDSAVKYQILEPQVAAIEAWRPEPERPEIMHVSVLSYNK